MPLLKDNRLIFNGLILKMNRCYNRMNRELKTFIWRREKIISYPMPGVSGSESFIDRHSGQITMT
jgi:hypothetical protein